MNRKKLVLFILLITLVLAIIWSYSAVPRQKTVSTLKYAPGQTQPPVKPATSVPAATSANRVPVIAITGDERIVRLDLLEREQSGFKGYRRNIFKPIFIDEIKAMMRKAAAPKPLPIPPVAAAPPPKVEPPPPIAQPVIQPEKLQNTLARFVFLGYLKKGNRQTIFLSKDKEIILVRKGDKFAGNFEARSVTDQALTIISIDTGEEIVIPLIENQPLSAAVK
ncbi:MAG: type II secretion system protein PulP [Desulfuromonadales bacterium]|nr:type II secretion system protein PulP [Desulfuromonadales bacterium]